MRRRGRTGANGFTLIEIMVALAVFALAAMALLRLEGQTIRSTGILRDTWAAQSVARNVAVEAVTDAQPPTGQASGTVEQGGTPWRWTRTARAIGDAGVVRVDVTVSSGAVSPGAGGGVIGRATMVRAPFEQASVAR